MNPKRKIHIKQLTSTRAELLDSQDTAGNTTRTLFLNMFSFSRTEDNQTTKYWRENERRCYDCDDLQLWIPFSLWLLLLCLLTNSRRVDTLRFPNYMADTWWSGTQSPSMSRTNKVTHVNKRTMWTQRHRLISSLPQLFSHKSIWLWEKSSRS